MPAFTEILNLSISASVLVVALILAKRFVMLDRVSRSWQCALWALVAIRLLLPFSIESPTSMLPTGEFLPERYVAMEPAEFDTPVRLEIVTNPVYDAELTVDLPTTVDRLQHWDLMATIVWLTGIAVMALYAAFSYLSLRLRLRMAGWVRDNIYECDGLETPFILGLLRPRIYLPPELDAQTRNHVLAHEKAHLKRLDHIWKPLGFALLSIHWFNPILWWGYHQFCRDLELACDEAVIKNLDKGAVRAYSESLLRCSVSRRSLALCPLAFGEVDVKGRIKSMLRRPKLTGGLLAGAILVTILLPLCFLTDPVTPQRNLDLILEQEDCRILSCREQTIRLEVRKEDLPENVLNGKKHSFSDSPILLSEFDNTRLLLTEARLSGNELLLTISISHDLPDTGSILLPVHPFEDGPEMQVRPAHADVVDSGTVYGNALVVRGLGPNSFDVGIRMDVWNQASEYIRFQLEGLYNLRYSFVPLPYAVDSHTVYAMAEAPLYGPRFGLNPDGTFTFSENPLSSYLGVGSYTLDGTQLIMKTDDGAFTWTFDLKNGELFFDGEHSSVVRWYPDLKHIQPLLDGARFVQQDIQTGEIEGLLEVICASPAQSSNPGAYIEAHPEEYARLIELEKATVSYCFARFARGGQTDLRGHIMAIACREIIGKTDITLSDTGYMTGQAWFDAFASNALSLRDQIGTQELSKFHPWQAMALDILGI